MLKKLRKLLINMVPGAGIEPACTLSGAADFKDSAQRAHEGDLPREEREYRHIRAHVGKKLPHLAIVSTAALAACGGSGTGDPSGTSAGGTSSSCKSTVTVQLYGDSTQVAAYRWGFLQAELDVRFGAGRVVLESQAVSGTNSEQLVAGTDGLNLPWPGSVDADIVMVNHGINDEGYHPADIATYAADMRAFAEAPGVRMIIETPNPIAPYRNIPDAPWADAGRAAAAEAGIPVADVQTYVLGLPGWEAMLSDGIHPSPELAQRIAKNVTAPTLEPIIDSMLCKRKS